MTQVLQGRLLAKCALPKAVLSENRFTGGHWASKSTPKHWRETKDWAFLLRSAAGLGLPQKQTTKRRKLVIKRLLCKRQRRFDTVNKFGGSVKSIQDALEDLGWLKNDAEKYCVLEFFELEPDDMTEWEYTRYDQYSARCIVELYELEEEIES